MSAVDDYQRMKPRDRNQVLLAEYRCPKRCLLLHIWQSPVGRKYYQPPYRLSPEVTENETVDSARRKRTEDGYRKWRGRGGSIDELIEFSEGLAPGMVGLNLTCDHIRAVLSAEQIAADIVAVHPGEPGKFRFPRGVS